MIYINKILRPRSAIPKVCSAVHLWSANPYTDQYFVLFCAEHYIEGILILSGLCKRKVWEPLAEIPVSSEIVYEKYVTHEVYQTMSI